MCANGRAITCRWLLLSAVVAAAGVLAEPTPEAKGLAIAEEADRRDQGFGDSAGRLTMTLRNRAGQETLRSMRSQTLEVPGDGDKSMVIFDDPKDVRGTAFLSFTYKEGPDDQWLYLPALKRVKRIASSNKSGPFMGSEFSYEDLSSQEVEKYRYLYLRNEAFDGRDHFVIERYPRDARSGYTRQVVWMDTEHYRVWKVEYYDRKESLLKTLTADQFTRYLDKHWRPLRMEMINHQTGKSTVLAWTDYTFGNGFTDADFNRNSLSKAR